MKYILAILFFLIILLFNFRLIVFNADFYESISEDNSNFDKERVVNLINYLKNKEQLNTENYTEKEILHLKDVKILINKILMFFYILLMTFIFLLVRYYKEFPNILVLSSLITISVVIILFLLNFSNLFYRFHLISFNNYLWLLDPETTLIKLFPEIFFKSFFAIVLFRSFIVSLFFLFIGLVVQFKHTFGKIKKIFIY